MRHFLIAFIIAVAASKNAFAVTDSEKRALAARLVSMLQFDRMAADSVKECASHDNAAADAFVSYRDHPDSFGGISPESPYWPQVRTAYEKYRATLCSYAAPDVMVEFFTSEFAKRASAEDLRASIAFYASSSGKRIQQMTVDANEMFQSFESKLMRQVRDQAEQQYQRDMQALIETFRSDPAARAVHHSVP